MKKLALYGAGDLGLGLLEVYRSCELASPTYADVFYVDDDPQAVAPDGIRLVDFDGLLREAAESDVRVAVCVGEPRVRQAIASRVRGAGLRLATLVDPSAKVSPRAELGEGCIVSGWSAVGANSVVGENSLLLGAIMSHNCRIGASCVLDSRSTLSCHVTVGDQTYVRIGAMVREGVTIGQRAIVDMGAAVFLDVEDDIYVTGNPARPMRRNEDQQVFRG